MGYTGGELRSHWLRERFGLVGDAMAGFVGPCHVKPEHVVDIEERISGQAIAGASMVHILCEHFQVPLPEMVVRQRLLAAIVLDVLREYGNDLARRVRRRGDDLYLEERKLSVSIATVSPVSALCHFGVNVNTDRVPVPAAGLEELGVDAWRMGPLVLERYALDTEQMDGAVVKVRPVP